MPILPSNNRNLTDPPKIHWQVGEDGLVGISLSGKWSMTESVVSATELFAFLAGRQRAGVVRLEVSQLESWDSTLPLFVRRLQAVCQAQGLMLNIAALPTAVCALLAQAEVPMIDDVTINPALAIRERIGRWVIQCISEIWLQTKFLGLVFIALLAVLRGQVRHRPGEFFYLIHQCGPSAVPIVTLICLLVGMILAFVGAVQLRMFGAQLYIADLVGLGMAREMGAMMTAVIMAGRTGAAYAAEIGTMRVNEEIDALRTLGIKPIELLVIPRILALLLVMPLLCVYADFMGILGGAIVTVGLFDISWMEYFNESRVWLDMTDINIGIVKSAVFAVLVAIAGCMRGMHCGTSSSGVGYAATSAVVTSIVWVVVADAIMTLAITAMDI